MIRVVGIGAVLAVILACGGATTPAGPPPSWGRLPDALSSLGRVEASSAECLRVADGGLMVEQLVTRLEEVGCDVRQGPVVVDERAADTRVAQLVLDGGCADRTGDLFVEVEVVGGHLAWGAEVERGACFDYRLPER